MKQFKSYKIWLTFSLLSIITAIIITIGFIASVPEDCPACNMAGVGIIPFLLLAFATLVINLIVIPIQLVRNRHKFSAKLTIISWTLLVTSAAATITTILLTIFFG